MTHTWVHANPEPLEGDALDQVNAWWRAANYLSIGQIYLLDNALLHEPLTRDHIKPRLLGHWERPPGSTSSTRTSTVPSVNDSSRRST